MTSLDQVKPASPDVVVVDASSIPNMCMNHYSIVLLATPLGWCKRMHLTRASYSGFRTIRCTSAFQRSLTRIRLERRCYNRRNFGVPSYSHSTATSHSHWRLETLVSDCTVSNLFKSLDNMLFRCNPYWHYYKQNRSLLLCGSFVLYSPRGRQVQYIMVGDLL